MAPKNPEDAVRTSLQRAYKYRLRIMARKQRFYYVYILSSLTGTLYTGVTNNIYNRTLQHKGKESPGFTSKYDVNRLVYYETFH